MPTIHVQHLSKSYEVPKKQPGILGSLRALVRPEHRTVNAVQDVSFSIEEGEIVGFIGPNGAGKTTTLKMLSGILWPSTGEATVLGHVPWKREAVFQRQFGIVMGAKNQLWWDLPARDTLLLNKEIYDIKDEVFDTRVQELSIMLGLSRELDTPVRKLSLGERMKCELVNALLHEPRVLLLDEPTIGLDVLSQKAIRDFLKAWNKKEKTTIMLTSHAMADVEALCERVIVIDHGTLKYDGSLVDLVKKFSEAKRVTVLFEKPITKKALSAAGAPIDVDERRAVFQVRREEVKTLAKTLLDSFPVADLLIEEPPLEEIIRAVFNRSVDTRKPS